MKLGTLKTTKDVTAAMREIRNWLEKISVSGLTINTNYDNKQNIAILQFHYKGKNYEFRSSKQNTATKNMHAIARVIEYKVRSQIMEIEDFEKSMKAYLQLEDHNPQREYASNNNPTNYQKLGLKPDSTNEEIETNYKRLCKAWHPDLAGSKEAKEEFEKKLSEINEAHTQIKKERGT